MLLLLLGLIQAAIALEHSLHEVLHADSLAFADRRGEVLPFPTDVVESIASSSTQPSAAPSTSAAVTCDREFYVCDSGARVRREPPTCEFAACPVQKANAALMQRLQSQVVDIAGDTYNADPIQPCEPDILECEDGTRVTRHLPSCEFAACPSVSPTQELPPRRHCHHCQSFVTNTTATDAEEANPGVAQAEPVGTSRSVITVTVTVTVTPDPQWGLPHNGFKGLIGTFAPLDIGQTTTQPAVVEDATSSAAPETEPTDADVLEPGMTSYDKAVVDEGSTIVRKQAVIAHDVPGVEATVQAGAPAKDKYIHRCVYGGTLILVILACGIFFMRKQKKKKLKKRKEEEAQAKEQAAAEAFLGTLEEEEEEEEEEEQEAEAQPES